MRGRILTAAWTLAVVLALAALLTAPTAGQAPARAAGTAKASALPRMSDGHPDLQGV